MMSKGFTLIEVLVASVIASLVAGGTMMAFVTAARLSRFQNSGHYAEAATLAQETFERFRNRVAADDNFFADAATKGWISDNLAADEVRGSLSIVATGMKRCYRVRPAECDGNAGISPQSGDCYAMAVQVCWNNEQTSCHCL